MAAAIESVGIVGGGFMGSGIAEAVARAGLPVRVQEPEPAPLDHARSRIEASLARAVKGGKLDESDAAEVSGGPGDRHDAPPMVSRQCAACPQ